MDKRIILAGVGIAALSSMIGFASTRYVLEPFGLLTRKLAPLSSSAAIQAVQQGQAGLAQMNWKTLQLQITPFLADSGTSADLAEGSFAYSEEWKHEVPEMARIPSPPLPQPQSSTETAIAAVPSLPAPLPEETEILPATPEPSSVPEAVEEMPTPSVMMPQMPDASPALQDSEETTGFAEDIPYIGRRYAAISSPNEINTFN